MAITTFVGQNLGAKQYDRAKKGAKFGILCSIFIAELIGITIYTAAPVLIAAFNRDPDVIHYGVMQARTIALVLLFIGIYSLYRGCTPGFRQCCRAHDCSALCMVSVPCQLHHTGSASDSGYPGHILGIPTDLEHQLGDFPVFVFKGKLGAWI